MDASSNSKVKPDGLRGVRLQEDMRHLIGEQVELE